MSALHDILHAILDIAHDVRQIDRSQTVKDLHAAIDEHAEAEADAAAKASSDTDPEPDAPVVDGDPAPAPTVSFSGPVQHG